MKAKGYEVYGLAATCFAENTNIEKVIMHDNIKDIYRYAFKACSNLKEVVFSENITVIPADIFNDCVSLNNVVIPAKVTLIEAFAFVHCKSLNAIEFKGAPEKIVSRCTGYLDKDGIRRQFTDQSVLSDYSNAQAARSMRLLAVARIDSANENGEWTLVCLLSIRDNVRAEAVEAIKDVQTVIIGGMDRGIDYGILEDFIEKNPQYTYIFMYDTGKRICEELGGVPEGMRGVSDNNLYLVDTLEEAVTLAKKLTTPGMACVMSPAAPSYGVFKNFEERGEKFKEYVLK
jgi:hypothetical protein